MGGPTVGPMGGPTGCPTYQPRPSGPPTFLTCRRCHTCNTSPKCPAPAPSRTPSNASGESERSGGQRPAPTPRASPTATKTGMVSSRGLPCSAWPSLDPQHGVNKTLCATGTALSKDVPTVCWRSFVGKMGRVSHQSPRLPTTHLQHSWPNLLWHQ